MENQVKAALIQEGGKLLNNFLQQAINRKPLPRIKAEIDEIETEKPEIPTKTANVPFKGSGYSAAVVDLPDREQTTLELKRRLAKELYKAELDLANGLMIAGRPCDCLSNKHTLQLEACAEELISQDPDNNVYQEINQWIVDNGSKVSPEAIYSGKYKLEYPHMALQFKEFRKRVLGSSMEKPAIRTTPKPAPMQIQHLPNSGEKQQEITLEEAQEIAAEQAKAEVRKRWIAQK